jgi:hypothetical protein
MIIKISVPLESNWNNYSQCFHSPSFIQIPPILRRVLSETHENEQGEIVYIARTAHFQQSIRVYNNAFAFMSAAYKINRNIPTITVVFTHSESRARCITGGKFSYRRR